jgi:neutral trehalase
LVILEELIYQQQIASKTFNPKKSDQDFLAHANLYDSANNIEAPTHKLIQSHSSMPVDSLTEQEQEQTLSNETKQNMLMEMLKCTLLQYKVDESLTA